MTAHLPITETLFCDRTFHALKSDVARKHVCDEISKILEMPWGTLVSSSTRARVTCHESLGVLQKHPYLACTETFGIKYMMYICRHEFINTCYFIEMRMKHDQAQPHIVIAHMGLGGDLYDGTVCVGEMLRLSDGKWIFLMEDVLVCGGYVQISQDLQNRLVMLGRAMTCDYTPDVLDPCLLQIKRYFSYNEMSKLLEEFIPSLPYGIKGITLRGVSWKQPTFSCPLDVNQQATERVRVIGSVPPGSRGRGGMRGRGRGRGQIGRKFDGRFVAVDRDMPCVERLLCVQQSLQPDIYELFESNAHDAVRVGVAAIQTLEKSKQMRSLFEDKGARWRVLMMCRYDPARGKWEPLDEAPIVKRGVNI